MSVIGEQIKKYRAEKGITQEQLGQLVGVTTQAVSRWECGGTPDAELLPRLSEVLDVSIDMLFGRKEQSLSLALSRKLIRMSREDAYRYAFEICWAIEVGLLGESRDIDDIMNRFIERPVMNVDKNRDYFAKVIHDNGIANARMSSDFYNFFLMLEPSDGIKNHLSSFEELRRVFELFADKKLLKIILFMYSRADVPAATSLISKSTGMTEPEVDRCMSILCENNLTSHSIVATADGDINSYTFRKECFAIPLLCFADEIAKKNVYPFFGFTNGANRCCNNTRLNQYRFT